MNRVKKDLHNFGLGTGSILSLQFQLQVKVQEHMKGEVKHGMIQNYVIFFTKPWKGLN